MLPNWLYGKSKSKLQEILGGGGSYTSGPGISITNNRISFRGDTASYDNTDSGLTADTVKGAIDELAHKPDIITLSVTKNDSIIGSSFVVKVRKQYNAIYISGYFNTAVVANRGDVLFTINGLSFIDDNDHSYAILMSASGNGAFAEIFSNGEVKVANEGGIASGYHTVSAAFLAK